MTMLGRVRLPTPTKDEDDELYSGYDDYHPAFNTKNINEDEYLQEALKSSYGKRTRMYTGMKTPGSAMRLGTSSGYREGAIRPVTGSMDPVSRPMTAVRGAGYTSQRNDSIITPRPSVTPMSDRPEERIEDKIRRIEKSIMDLVDQSCIAGSNKEYQTALEKAKEASAKEKNLIRLQEQSGMGDTHNLELTSLRQEREYEKNLEARMISIYTSQVDLTCAIAYCIGTGVIGMSLFNILEALKTENYASVVLFGLMVICETLVMYVLSALGEAIADESVRLRDQVYFTKWHNLDDKNRKILLIFSSAMTEPVVISGMGLINLSLDTFSSIMNTAYSFFNLMNTQI